MAHRLAGLFGLLLWIGATLSAVAQEDPRQTALAGWSATLDRIAADLRNPRLSHADLDRIYADAASVQDAASELAASLAPEIATVEARLQALARPPGDTAADPEIVIRGRADQQMLLDSLSGLSNQANLVAARAGEFAAAIDAERTLRFSEALLSHERSIFSPIMWADVAASSRALVDRLDALIDDARRSAAGRPASYAAAMLLAMIAAVAAAFLVGTAVLRRGIGTGDQPPARPVVAASLRLVAIAGGTLLVLIALRGIVIRDDLGGAAPLFEVAGRAALDLAIVVALAGGLLAPGRPDRRVLHLPETAARTAYRLFVFAGIAAAAMGAVEGIARSAAPTLAYAAPNAGLAVLVAGLVLLAARAVARGAAGQETEPAPPHLRWSWLVPVAGLAAIGVIGAAMIGYLAFAAFLAEQIVWVWGIVTLTALGMGLIDLAAAAIFAADGPIGRSLAASFLLSRRLLELVAIVVAGLARLLLLLLAVLAVAAPWGIDSTDVTTRLAEVANGFRIGSITISLQSVAAAIGLFVVVLIVGRLFHGWLAGRLLPATGLDTGLKDSVLTVVSYAGFILAVIAALAYAGLGLSNIAIVAGALSVGIGFGLQSIVGNFVSGLILLAERPIRAGDWIEVGSDRGTVRRISVRATEILTPDRASVMIPNSNLISGVVKNISLRDASGRIVISIGVAYGSDPERVRQILLDCARAHPQVLADPPPYVVFQDFGASALTFELDCFITDNRLHNAVVSDLRFAILKRMNEEGIEIPFPQQDLNLRDWPKIEKALLGLLEAAAASPRARPSAQSGEPSP